MGKFEVEFKKSAIKQLRKFPRTIQTKIINSIEALLTVKPYVAEGKHVKKLIDGYRLRIGDCRVFYYIEAQTVVITSVMRRTSTTY